MNCNTECKHKKYRFNVEKLVWEIWDDTDSSTWNHDWREIKETEINDIPEKQWKLGVELYIKINKGKLNKLSNYIERDKEEIKKYSSKVPRQSLVQLMASLKDLYFDTSLKYSDDRVAKVLSVIGDKGFIIDDLLDEIENKRYNNKFGSKSKRSPRAETDSLSKGLEFIANYLLFPEFMNKVHEDLWMQDNSGRYYNNYGENSVKIYNENKRIILENYYRKTDGYPLIKESELKNSKYHDSLERLRENEEKLDEISEDKSQYFELEKKYNKTLRNQIEISKKDLLVYTELKNMRENSSQISILLGHGKDKKTKERCEDEVKKRFLDKIKKSKYQSNDIVSKAILHNNKRLMSIKSFPSEKEKHEYELTILKSKLAKAEYDFEKEQSKNMEAKISNIKSKILALTTSYMKHASEYNKEFNEVFTLKLPSNIPIGNDRYGTEIKIKGKNYNPIGFPSNWTENKYYNELKKLYSNIEYEMKVVREELRKPFYYRNVSESTIHDYDYFFFNFSDITHVRKLLKQYYKLKNSSVEDVRILVDEFDDYIEVADLTEIEKEIIFYFRTDSTVSEIVKRVAFEYQIDEKKVRRMINNTIPKKIANTYKVLKDEYIMDKYKIKGKKCSKCGLIKLACKRNFGRHPKTTDGYQSICKQCDNLRK